MTELPGIPQSLWLASTDETAYPSLGSGIEVDVVVIGGGITGLTTALLLKREGRSVAVLESHRIAEGVSGYTTAKVSSQHGLIYADLVKSFGEDGARAYGASNEAAKEWIADLIETEKIDCDFERRYHCVYSEDPAELEHLESEANAALTLGLPASFVHELPLPFPVAGGVRFEDQAQFHPRKYLLHMAALVDGDGSFIFENTRCTGVHEGDVCTVETERGDIRASHVVVASHYPFLDRGLFFARMAPYRSYCLAAALDPHDIPDGMFISEGSETRSLRSAHEEGTSLLLVGGEGHKVGQEPDTEGCYRRLEGWAEKHFPIRSFRYRWSTQDNVTVDKVPFIGRLRRSSKNLYLGTGYGKWGMTNGTVAAMILRDAILERHNEWASLYDPHRVKPVAQAKEFVSENLNVAQHFIGDRLNPPDIKEPDDLEEGEGAIVRAHGRRAAAYRDDNGRLETFSHVCTHLGCYVRWNPAEKSFDCPCHGSRYDRRGRVIQGPAVRDLPPRELGQVE
jgi:glycine/D-amino acid oxidase-like deaminating enzyme/nitrite reductase/ring-hydroxylating ferredoxin subunit